MEPTLVPLPALGSDRSSRTHPVGTAIPTGDMPALLWEVLPSLIHDLRGPATALVAFAHLLADPPESEAGGARGDHVAAVGANAELLASQLEGLAFLSQAARRAPADVGEVLRTIPGRLQKVLSRSTVSLNLHGETPDTPVERRSATVLVEGILRVLLREIGRSAEASISLAARACPDGVLTVTIAVTPTTDPRRERAAAPFGAVAGVVAAAVASADFSGLVLRTALEVLEGVVDVRPAPQGGPGALVVVALRSPLGHVRPSPPRRETP